jgi:uncharacterized protein (TIGR03083 family)
MAEETEITIASLLRRIEHGWNDLQAYLGTLSEEQLTKPTDAAGWTVKDHLIHLAIWEDGVYALLEGRSQREGMEVDEATWRQGIDAINAVIQQRYHDLPLGEVLETFRVKHERLVSRIKSMTDDDLLRPYRHYDTASDREQPVVGWIVGNTFEHYAEHKPWIAAIVGQL